MITTPKVDWLALSPTLALLGASGVALLGSVLVPWWMRRGFTAFVAFAGFVTAGVFAAIVFDETAESRTLIAESFTRDRLGALAAIIVAGAGALTVLVSWGENRRDHVGEYYALLAAAGAGMAFFVTAGNLMTLFLGLEWFSIALYILCALDTHRETLARGRAQVPDRRRLRLGDPPLRLGARLRRDRRARLLRRSQRRGDARRRAAARRPRDADRRARLQGLGGAVPHVDARRLRGRAHLGDGASWPRRRRSAALVLTLRILVVAFPEQEHLWTIAIAVLACVSLAVGNLAALVQRNVKRLLAYSSVSHAGFMLIAVAANSELGGRALLYYLIPYGAMSIGAFAVVAARERELGAPGHARQPRRDGLGAAVPRRRDVGLHARRRWACRSPAACSASSTSSPPPTRRALVADRRRRDRDRDLALLLPRRRSGRSTCGRRRSCGRRRRAARRLAIRCCRARSSSRSSSRSARSSSCSR